MKKETYLALFVLLVAFFAIGSSVGATGLDTGEMTPTASPTIFYDEEIEEYYDVEEGGYIEVFEVKGGEVVGPVNMEEYVERRASEAHIENEENAETINLNTPILKGGEVGILSPSVWYRYAESSNYTTLQYGGRASIIQKNPGPGSDEFYLGFSYTKTQSYNMTLSTNERAAINAGAGFTWSTSASIESGHTMTLLPGYQGYWRFDPRVRVTVGTLRQYTHGFVTSTKSVRGYSPVKLNKLLDGEITAVKTPM